MSRVLYATPHVKYDRRSHPVTRAWQSSPMMSFISRHQIRCIFLLLQCLYLHQILFEHLLESSHRDDSNKWSNIGFGEVIMQAVSIEVNFMHLIWGSCVLYIDDRNSVILWFFSVLSSQYKGLNLTSVQLREYTYTQR